MFGAMDDDDLDFNPAAGSKLASVFGLERSPEKGNASLTYTAPKQPKHHLHDDTISPKKNSLTSAATNKLSLIVAKAVTSFKLEDGNYSPQGKQGLALLGNSSSRLFQLLLYKGKQQQITTVKITPKFQFTVQPHLYATFYDDRTQNWSIMFESNDDVFEFTTQVAVARYRSGSPGEEFTLIQELFPGSGSCLEEGAVVDLKLAAQPFTLDSVQAVGHQQYTIHCTLSHMLASGDWAAGLIGAAPGSIRVILVPLSVQVPWLSSKRNEPLLIEAHIKSPRSSEGDLTKESALNEQRKSRNSTTASGVDGAVESGAEDVRARGVSIKETLTCSPRSHKASIISRMARMGQATLPLKGAIAFDPSDSEETEEDLKTHHGSVKPSPKTRQMKPRIGSSTHRQQPASLLSSSNLPISSGTAPTAVSVVPTTQWSQQQNMMRSASDAAMVQVVSSERQLLSMGSQQQLPLVAATVMSPSDPSPHISMFLSEARMQNTEMRMHLSKFNDKMDQLLTKVDNLHVSSGPSLSNTNSAIGLEPNVLLSSVEKLVKDNQLLQAEVVEKNKRLDEQNERIFSLLNTNSKFLEQSSSLLEQKQLQEQKHLNQEDQQKKQEEQLHQIHLMREEKVSLCNQLGSLQSQLVAIQELVQALQKSNTNLSQELEATRIRLQEKENSIRKMDSNNPTPEMEKQLHHLNEALKTCKKETLQLQEQLINERSQHYLEIQATEDRLMNIQEQYKTEVTAMQGQINKQADYYTKVIQNLEDKCQESSNKLQVQTLQPAANSSASSENIISSVKVFMNTLHKGLNQQFIQGQCYDGTDIKKIISLLVKREALQFVEKLEKENSSLKTLLVVDGDKESSMLDVSVEKSAVIENKEVKISEEKAVEKSSNTSKHATSNISQDINASQPATNTTTSSAHERPEQCVDAQKDADPSFERPWRVLPPPPPSFHEDEDSDDWLA